ncbi:MAG: hypothetical protein KBF88_11615 [Polyangiaceae bacterium]|nr:hypothetical protein [Polyangiaceae bacterium]
MARYKISSFLRESVWVRALGFVGIGALVPTLAKVVTANAQPTPIVAGSGSSAGGPKQVFPAGSSSARIEDSGKRTGGPTLLVAEEAPAPKLVPQVEVGKPESKQKFDKTMTKLAIDAQKPKFLTCVETELASAPVTRASLRIALKLENSGEFSRNEKVPFDKKKPVLAECLTRAVMGEKSAAAPKATTLISVEIVYGTDLRKPKR